MDGLDRGRINGDERRWVVGFALFSLLLTLSPYLLAFARQGSEWIFSGFLFGVDDGNSYIAKMLSGAYGAWVFRTPYSTVPQNGLFFLFLPYRLLGKLAAAPELHLQLVLLFHFFRLAAGLAVVLAVYDFIAFFEPRRAYRRLGVVLVTFGGGLGWLLVVIGQSGWLGSLPLDLYSPETFGFLAFFGLPHLAFGRAFMLWGLLDILRSPEHQRLSRGLKAGAFWLLAGLFNPLAPAIAWLVVGASLLLRVAIRRWRVQADLWPDLKAAALAVLISAPTVAYSVMVSISDPFFRQWTEQNTITSPHFLHYLIAFALFLPWAYRGARRSIVSNTVQSILPVVWVALFPILAYAPTNLQRRLPEGLFVALVVLALRGLGSQNGVRLSLRHSVPLLLAFPSTLILLAGGVLAAWTPAQPVFRPVDEVSAFEFLAEYAQPGAVVLAPMVSSNPLPAFAPLRVVLGHGPETIGFAEIQPRVEAFFAGELDAATVETLLEEFGVDYVLVPAGYKSLSEVSGLGTYLAKIYDQAGYAVFRAGRY